MMSSDKVMMAVSAIAMLGGVNSAWAQDFAISEEEINAGKQQYSPYLHQSYPNRVFWGDTHLHTSYSTDAGLVGNTVGPEERPCASPGANRSFPRPGCRRA